MCLDQLTFEEGMEVASQRLSSAYPSTRDFQPLPHQELVRFGLQHLWEEKVKRPGFEETKSAAV
jgi:hypothetical protein